MNVCLAGTPLPVSEVEAMNKGLCEVQVAHNLLVNAIEIETANKVVNFVGEMQYIGIEFTIRGRGWTVYSLTVPVESEDTKAYALNKEALFDIAPEVRKYLWEYCRSKLVA